jgi:hypothetical protein
VNAIFGFVKIESPRFLAAQSGKKQSSRAEKVESEAKKDAAPLRLRSSLHSPLSLQSAPLMTFALKSCWSIRDDLSAAR